MHNKTEIKFDPHLFVLPAFIPSSCLYPWTLKENTDDEGYCEVLCSSLGHTGASWMFFTPNSSTRTFSPFNLLSHCIISLSPSLHIPACSAVTTPRCICLSIFLPFSAVTLFFQTRSLVKGLCCNCTEAPACWNTVAPLAAVRWFIQWKTFYSLSTWLREPLGSYGIERWQRNLRLSVDVCLRLSLVYLHQLHLRILVRGRILKNESGGKHMTLALC